MYIALQWVNNSQQMRKNMSIFVYVYICYIYTIHADVYLCIFVYVCLHVYWYRCVCCACWGHSSADERKGSWTARGLSTLPPLPPTLPTFLPPYYTHNWPHMQCNAMKIVWCKGMKWLSNHCEYAIHVLSKHTWKDSELIRSKSKSISSLKGLSFHCRTSLTHGFSRYQKCLRQQWRLQGKYAKSIRIDNCLDALLMPWCVVLTQAMTIA